MFFSKDLQIELFLKKQQRQQQQPSQQAIDHRRHLCQISAILLFVHVYGAVALMKPAFFFSSDGSVRQFSIGRRKTTFFPIWLFALVLGILCYLLVWYR